MAITSLGTAFAELKDGHSLRLAPRKDERPRVAIVIDDLGLDWQRFRASNALPMPVTLAFLPYGADAQAMLDRTTPRHEAILHLPMEPKRRKHHAGPDAVKLGRPEAVRRALSANFAKLEGFRGVNNHTGSALTEDPGAMAVVLSDLARRDLYFLDSRTSLESVATELAPRTGAVVIEGDLFLDGDFGRGGRRHVAGQLALLERIAEREGSAVGIGHPYPTTLAALTSWAEEAQLRLRFVTTGELAAEKRAARAATGF